jgi:cation diffusion facilitator CzcD-associated flavoprotein CzcO
MVFLTNEQPTNSYGSKITKERSYDTNGYTYYPVVIIGAGASGIAMGCRLKEVLDFDQFRIFDRQAGIGGTWWINRYPGVAVDVPAVFYSFSFSPNHKWTSFHPEGPEIVKYLQGVCEKYKIVDKIQLNTDVSECRWNEKEGIWELKVQHLALGAGDLSAYDREALINERGSETIYIREESIRTKVLISAVGGIVEPKQFPEKIPGRDKFQGEIFHSARWNYDVDLKDKEIIVVGTGCSAAQFVPKLTREYGAKSVTQIMRSPPWVVPRPQPPFGKEIWEEWGPWINTNIPGFAKSLRYLIAVSAEADWRLFGDGEFSANERTKLEKQLIEHMKKTTPEKYHEASYLIL